jgi:hypothetical protein
MLVHLVPLSCPLWQVSAGPEGEVVFTRAVCIALAQHNEDGGRVAVPMVVGEHISVPDGRPEHVGYTDSEDPIPWVEKCKARRKELDAKEQEAKRAKVWVPEKQEIGKFH